MTATEDLYKDDERFAQETGSNRKQLKVRLNEAKAALPEHQRNFFRHAKYVFEEQRLYSEDGKWALQWKLRRQPDMPISAKNPQAKRGDVELIKIK